MIKHVPVLRQIIPAIGNARTKMRTIHDANYSVSVVTVKSKRLNAENVETTTVIGKVQNASVYRIVTFQRHNHHLNKFVKLFQTLLDNGNVPTAIIQSRNVN